jgi:hypothetical protein
MGIEAFVPIVLALGVTLFALLLIRSLSTSSRPYALPTLLAALAFAGFMNNRDGHQQGYFWSSLIAWFCLGAIMFGLHALAIKWLVRRTAGVAAS